MVLNQKCIRKNRIDYAFAQFTDDSKKIPDSKFLKRGDILVNSTGKGTAGRCAIVTDVPSEYRLIVDSHILILRCNTFAEAQCLNYNLFYFENKLMSFMTGSSGQSELDKVALLGLQVKIPVNPESQQRISSLLTNIETKIALNNRITIELEMMAKMLYDYWFVQFDFPNSKGEPYKSSGGKMVYNTELKREIPAGWDVSELRRFISSNRGVSYSGKDIVGHGTPMINLNSFNVDSTYKPEGIKSYSGKYEPKKILRPFDLVMCNTQQTELDPTKDIIGKSFLVPDVFDSAIVSSHHVTTLRVSTESLKFYLNSLFHTEYFHRYISGYAAGTNILGLNFDGVLRFKIPIPPDALLQDFQEIALNGEKQKALIIKENQSLASLRDWLLPTLMNGQVKVA